MNLKPSSSAHFFFFFFQVHIIRILLEIYQLCTVFAFNSLKLVENRDQIKLKLSSHILNICDIPELV